MNFSYSHIMENLTAIRNCKIVKYMKCLNNITKNCLYYKRKSKIKILSKRMWWRPKVEGGLHRKIKPEEINNKILFFIWPDYVGFAYLLPIF